MCIILIAEVLTRDRFLKMGKLNVVTIKAEEHVTAYLLFQILAKRQHSVNHASCFFLNIHFVITLLSRIRWNFFSDCLSEAGRYTDASSIFAYCRSFVE